MKERRKLKIGEIGRQDERKGVKEYRMKKTVNERSK